VLGVAQGRVVGQAFQFERPAQLGEILEQGYQPSIVGAKELPQHQAGKQLGLREALRGVFEEYRGSARSAIRRAVRAIHSGDLLIGRLV
jgi:hypothetical protein